MGENRHRQRRSAYGVWRNGGVMDLLTEDQAIALLNGKGDERIEYLEKWLLKQEQIELPVNEEFVNGIYVRKMFIPAGCLLTGAAHKSPYMDFMMYGDIALATADGAKRLSGANIMEAAPGHRRAGYAFKDTLWVTVHRVEQFKPGEMRDELTFPSMAEYQAYAAERDQNSYQLVEASQKTDEEPQLYSAPSIIHGNGVFSTASYQMGDTIGNVTEDIDTHLNHSASPNSIIEHDEQGQLWLVAVRKIPAGDEITVYYGTALKSAEGAICQ